MLSNLVWQAYIFLPLLHIYLLPQSVQNINALNNGLLTISDLLLFLLSSNSLSDCSNTSSLTICGAETNSTTFLFLIVIVYFGTPLYTGLCNISLTVAKLQLGLPFFVFIPSLVKILLILLVDTPSIDS